MCGLIGICGTRPVDEAALGRGLAALVHRGPDGSGQHVHGNDAVGHRRLSIIDLSGGAQPLRDEAGTAFLVANGEIYNYRKLQDELEAAGVRLLTGSDCEPILPLYRRHGLDFVNKLHGMYALALLDQERGEIVLARDPFGIKPLYYADSDAGIAFASEPQSLAAAGWAGRNVNKRALGPFFHRNYAGGRETLWLGIQRVMPGEVLRLRGGRIVERRRHVPDLKPPLANTEADALVELDARLKSAVTSHLQADVPYGLFLSGGIDSTTLLAMMQRIVAAKGEQVRSYTIGFASGTVADEREHAESLAAKLKTLHQSALFDVGDFWTYLPEMARRLDDPVADYAALPLLKLASIACRDVKVILSGEGGDEIFAGYGRYRRRIADFLLRSRFRRPGIAGHFPSLFGPEIAGWRGDADIKSPAGMSELQRRQYVDINDWLPDDLLNKVDRCLMAYGIEGRVPLLDDELAAFAFSLPDKLKMRGRDGKWLLKTWLHRNSSEADVWRKKRGFTVPVTEWLTEVQEPLSRYFLKHEGLAEFIHRKEFVELLASPLDQKAQRLLWPLLVFAAWHDVHIAQKEPLTGLVPESWAR